MMIALPQHYPLKVSHVNIECDFVIAYEVLHFLKKISARRFWKKIENKNIIYSSVTAAFEGFLGEMQENLSKSFYVDMFFFA